MARPPSSSTLSTTLSITRTGKGAGAAPPLAVATANDEDSRGEEGDGGPDDSDDACMRVALVSSLFSMISLLLV
jgi:hypothetical protein